MATENAPQKRFTAQQIASRRKALRKQRITVIASCVLAMVVLIALIIGMTLYQDRPIDDGRILPNVHAAGIDLSGMTQDEARNALHLATHNTLSQKDMVIQLPDETLTLSPKDTKVALDVNEVVKAAYNYGRSGSDRENKKVRKNAENTTHTIALLPYMNLNLDYIQKEIQEFSQSYGSQLTQPTTFIAGQRPTFDPEHPQATVTHQVLTITMGTPDYALNAQDLYDRVLDAYSLNVLKVNYEAPTLTEPQVPSAEELFQTYCAAPKNAEVISVKYHEVQPEVYGYGFDIDALQKRIDEAGYGAKLQVTLQFLMPQVTAKDLNEGLFADVLSAYTSVNPSGNNNNRNTNLAVSCAAINGIVLQPGEEFSFNETIGRPTAEKGYKKAPINRKGEVVEDLGGGISQTASALYYCALMANLDILERHNNYYSINYIPLGLDAYVDWGGEDLRIRNNTGSMLRIVATSEDNAVTIQLLGVSELEYDISITTEELKEIWPDTIEMVVDKDNVYGYTDGQKKQSGLVGYEIQTLINTHDRVSGELISSMPIDISVYSKRDVIIIRLETVPLPEEPTDPTLPADPTDPSAPEEIPTEPSIPTEPTPV